MYLDVIVFSLGSAVVYGALTAHRGRSGTLYQTLRKHDYGGVSRSRPASGIFPTRFPADPAYGAVIG